VGGDDTRCDVGAMAHIVDCQDFGDGRYHLAGENRERIRVTAWLEDDPYPRADVETWPDESGAAVTADDNRRRRGPADGVVRADRRVAAGVVAASPEPAR